MNAVWSFLLKATGLPGKAFSLVNGNKTYIGAAGLALSGIASITSGVACALAKISEAPDSQGLLDLGMKVAQNPSQDPCGILILAGVAAVAKALSDAGLRHAIEKNATESGQIAAEIVKKNDSGAP